MQELSRHGPFVRFAVAVLPFQEQAPTFFGFVPGFCRDIERIANPSEFDKRVASLVRSLPRVGSVSLSSDLRIALLGAGRDRLIHLGLEPREPVIAKPYRRRGFAHVRFVEEMIPAPWHALGLELGKGKNSHR
jgi:hypothetical protein